MRAPQYTTVCASGTATNTMSAISSLDIQFSDPSATYLEGQEVKGEVIVELKEDTAIEKLFVELSGLASIQWVKQSRSQSRDGPPNISSASEEEKYLGDSVTIYSREDKDNEQILVPAGSHSYPFCIRLPYDIPSTVSGRHGNVAYLAKATLERPWQPAESASKEFRVKNLVDLNQLPQALRPIHSFLSRPHTLFCCIQGGIEAEWRLEKMGYVVGDKICITGEIRNSSRLRIRKSKAIFVQHIRYYDHYGRSLHERREIGRITKGEVLPGQTDPWKEELIVPDVPPTGLKGCNLMDMCYTITLKLRTSGITERLETTTDIIIATIGEGQPGVSTPYNPPTINRAALDAAADLSYFI